jgi:hypothetical protein
MKEIYDVAGLRYSLQIPPGYKDKEPKKDAIKQYGDYVVWYQLIEYAKGMKKPIILAIDDTKEDWWKKEDGKTIGPRPELIEEMYSKGGVAFYMYNVGEFMKYAREMLGIKVEQKAIDEAINVGEERVEKESREVLIRCANCDTVFPIPLYWLVERLEGEILTKVHCPFCGYGNAISLRRLSSQENDHLVL